jgi:hypothetical protein
METYGGLEVLALTILRIGNGQLHVSAAYAQRRNLNIHWRVEWVGPRTGRKRNICFRRGLNSNHPARSLSLYRLSYPGFLMHYCLNEQIKENEMG